MREELQSADNVGQDEMRRREPRMMTATSTKARTPDLSFPHYSGVWIVRDFGLQSYQWDWMELKFDLLILRSEINVDESKH
jgi:hypothetical protein